jgi:hypothetical protein
MVLEQVNPVGGGHSNGVRPCPHLAIPDVSTLNLYRIDDAFGSARVRTKFYRQRPRRATSPTEVVT